MADVALLEGLEQRVRDDLADEIELPLELALVGHALGAADEELAVHRLGGAHQLRQARIVDRHAAPAEEFEPFFADEPFPDLFAVRAQAVILRHEHLADAVMPRCRQRDAELGALVLQELMRDLDEDAGAVACPGLGPFGTAVLQIFEDRQRVLDDRMARAVLQVGDEADAAGIDLAFGIVQTLRARPGHVGGLQNIARQSSQVSDLAWSFVPNGSRHAAQC